MGQGFFRVVELLFTAYAVPALSVPLVWLARRLHRALRPVDLNDSPRGLRRAVSAYALLWATWLAVWLALRLGVPIERGGRTAGAILWLGYGMLNLVLAWLLVRFTADYGSLPDGPVKDRLFLRFLSAVIVHPLATAWAFTVLFRIMGLVYHLKAPALTGVQEGI